jgi:pimeloyl-ACP methyl ester carboxylesterase
VQWKWANKFEGADQFLYERVGLALVAPGSSVRDLNTHVDGERLSGERLVSQASSETSAGLGLDFAIPMFFFQGAEDFTTPTALAHQYLDALRAPQKAFVAIEGGGHFAMFMKPDQFLKELVARVRPLAVTHPAN